MRIQEKSGLATLFAKHSLPRCYAHLSNRVRFSFKRSSQIMSGRENGSTLSSDHTEHHSCLAHEKESAEARNNSF
jgi:hypothetical protein